MQLPDVIHPPFSVGMSKTSMPCSSFLTRTRHLPSIALCPRLPCSIPRGCCSITQDLANVERTSTPWILTMFHCPWHNSNSAHQGERQADTAMRTIEPLLLEHRIALVITGHVHGESIIGTISAELWFLSFLKSLLNHSHR